MTHKFVNLQETTPGAKKFNVIFRSVADEKLLMVDAVDFLLGRFPEKGGIKSAQMAKAAGTVIMQSIDLPEPNPAP